MKFAPMFWAISGRFPWPWATKFPQDNIVEVMNTEVAHDVTSARKVTAIHISEGREGVDAGTLPWRC